MFNRTTTHKTRPWKITLMILLSFIAFLVVWLTVGEFDLLSVDYIVPKNGVLWKGLLSEIKIDWLVDHYSKYGVTREGLIPMIGKHISITNSTDTYIFNPLFLIWVFLALFISFLIPLVFKLFSFVNYDSFSFVFAFAMGFVVLMFTSLIPYWERNEGWKWFLRIFIFSLTFILLFLVLDAITSSLLMKLNQGSSIINEMKSNKLKDDMANSQSREVFEEYRKQKSKKEITSIEVDKS